MIGRKPKPAPADTNDLYENARGGDVTLTCANCGRTFRSPEEVKPRGNPMRFCSETCSRQYENRTYYQRHK